MPQRLRRYRSCRDLARSGALEDGVYRSPWHQGLYDGMEWLRLSLTGAAEGALVCLWAADDPARAPQAPTLTLRGRDLLLYGLRGRFLRFAVTPAPGLTGYELTFPGLSLDAALPAALRGDEGLRPFLGVCQSLAMDLAGAYARFPRRLDPRGEDPLPALYRWLGADWALGAPPPVGERLLAHAARLNRARGTRRGLALLLKLTTGGGGEIVEAHRWRALPLGAAERADCARLYGADVTVLLPAGLPADVLSFLHAALPDFLPAGVSWAIRVLSPGAAMDELCCLEENAQLTEEPPPALDEAVLDGLVLE